MSQPEIKKKNKKNIGLAKAKSSYKKSVHQNSSASTKTRTVQLGTEENAFIGGGNAATTELLACIGEGHGDTDGGDVASDEILAFYMDMLYSGILQMAQKAATQHGACLALTAFWKNSMGSYHENGKIKYRKAAHMKVAASAGVLGEKVMMDSTFNSLVNDQGIFPFFFHVEQAKTL